jgi:endoglycosylceramidase
MKIYPYIPDLEGFSLDTSFSEIDMQNLKNWGINSIRLGVMWPGVEPNKGEYN